MRRGDSFEKSLILGKTEGRKRRRQQNKKRRRWLDSITDSTDMNLPKLQEIVNNKEAWSAAVHEDAELDMMSDNNKLLNLEYLVFFN